MLDFIFSRLPLIAFNLVDRKNAGVDNATNGVPVPVDIIPFKESKNSTILSSIDAKVVIVLSPNKTDSVAFLEPNNILPDWIIVVGASILTDSIAFKFTDLIELKSKWSWFVFNIIRPELYINWGPLNLFISWGGLLG